jgi:hypothetical protein
MTVDRKGLYRIELEAAKHIQRSQFKLHGVEEDIENVWIYDNEEA